MASSYAFPSNLLTNTYILHDFSEIAYIVCTGAIPATLDKNSNLQDANSRQRVLGRLRNAEQQFRYASILTILDAEKLELFTFYKKVDIVKDQKTILTKFGHVCKLNHCIIAYKNACRVAELLKPDMSRVYRLFTAAVISSLQLHTPNSGKVIAVNSQIYLLQSPEILQPDWSLTEKPCTQWLLRRVDLQIVQSGQLLLAIRHANWPALTAMTDLIDPDVSPVDYSRGITLYLVPTGQLARYKGNWVSSFKPESEEMMKLLVDSDTLQCRSRWFQKVRDWLNQRGSTSVHVEPGTMWLEAEIPVLAQTEEPTFTNRRLVWKTIYWPVSLCYAFSPTYPLNIKDDTFPADPFEVAKEWHLEGARAARLSDSDRPITQNQDLGRADDRLFDDDVHFGSPQQFVNLPMQAFANAQTVYPTPPEALNTQPTPGMSIDGTVQTPATVPQTHTTNYNSSPLATMTDIGSAPPNEQAISNFLDHDNDDDLFDDIEEEKLGHDAFADEPNWDFFNTGNVEAAAKQNIEESTVNPELSIQKGQSEEVQHSLNAGEGESPSFVAKNFDQPGEGDLQQAAHVDSHDSKISAVDSLHHFPGNEHIPSTIAHQPHTSPGSYELSSMTPQPDNSHKRRRSSIYDITLAQEPGRDLKYSTNGKYWFEVKRPAISSLNKYPVPLPMSRRRSSSSSSTDSSSTPHVLVDEQDTQPKLRTWAEYDPVTPIKPQDDAGGDEFNVFEYDLEVQALLELIALASGLEPFVLPYPSQKARASNVLQSHEHDSMVTQVLIEQLTQSCLFKHSDGLRFPSDTQFVPFEISVDNAGSNSTLSGAQLGDLAAIQTANMQNKVGSRIVGLDHGKIRLKQADVDIAAELSIVHFWEILNLQPYSGSKNVLAICLHPSGDKYRKGSESFLQRIGETWSSCNLGCHEVARLDCLNEPGLAEWTTANSLSLVCKRIGKALALAETEDCTILYMVVPDDDLKQCWKLCDAFVQLFEVLVQSRQPDTGDVVLQLIPSSFVVGNDTIVVPPEQEFIGLALETYHRIPSVSQNPDNAETPFCAAAMVLEEPIALNLHFELNSKIISPLARYGQCFHLAYCFSLDKRWLVATWSDSSGGLSMSVPYALLDQDGNAVYSRLEVFRHMCDTSADMMNRRRTKWWLSIVKVGLFETEELQDWSVVTSQLSDKEKAISRIVLLNTELQSRLALHNPVLSQKQFQISSHHTRNMLNTPVTTPQATSTTSPDQIVSVTPTTATSSAFAANAQTPPEQNAEPGSDNDTFVTDPLEDSWILTLSFGLNQSHNFLEIRPALATGFLLKKTTPNSSGGAQMAILSVSLVAVPRKPSTGSPLSPQEREQILDEILVQYRGLHTLAIARKCIEEQGNCIPWHIASAYKGARVLESLL